MITPVPMLHPRERTAVAMLLGRVLAAGRPPLLRAFLFGSTARGDDDEDSDIDVLLICDSRPDALDAAAEYIAGEADRVAEGTRVEIEPWTIAAADLERGWRTPMLVDALEDGVPIWPRGAAPLRLPFTPADARFCADCLLDWVAAGGPIVRRALAGGHRAAAARRARDDTTRLATAALLLVGQTRHRRAGTLARFEERFVRPRIFSPRLLPALAWARAAYPPDGGRGSEDPPAAPGAIATAELGHAYAAAMEGEVGPWILARMRRIAGRAGAMRGSTTTGP